MDPIVQGAWSTLSRAPKLRIAVPFILGIVLAMWFPGPIAVGSGILVLTTIAAITVMRMHVEFPHRWVRGPFVFIWFFVFGWFWQTVRDPLQHPLHFSHQQPTEALWIMQLNTINGSSAKIIRADATVQYVGQNDTLKPSNGRVMMTLLRHDDGSEPRAGDILIVRTRMEPITRIPDPGGFDRRSWAASRGMYHECFAGPQNWVVTGHGWRLSDLFLGPRTRVSEWLVESGLPLRERAMVKALVLGMRDELDGAQRDAFVRSGTIHILAVSGTHVGFIYLMLLFMFHWLGGGHKARLVRGLIILVALWCYAGLPGGSPSVLRATIMFTLVHLSGHVAPTCQSVEQFVLGRFHLVGLGPAHARGDRVPVVFLGRAGIVSFHAPIERKWIPDNVGGPHLDTVGHVHRCAAAHHPVDLVFLQGLSHVLPSREPFRCYRCGFCGLWCRGHVGHIPDPVPWAARCILSHGLANGGRSCNGVLFRPSGAYPRCGSGSPKCSCCTHLSFQPCWWSSSNGDQHCGSLGLPWLVCCWCGATGRAQCRRKNDSWSTTTGTPFKPRCPWAVHCSIADDDIQDVSGWTRKKLDRHQRSTGSDDPVAASFATMAGTDAVQVGPTVMGGGRWSSLGIDVRFFTEDDPDLPATDMIDVLVIHDHGTSVKRLLGTLRTHAARGARR
ncbi:MAG: ComEC/Rec2 family competence protein [Flavobacteriales bacterium]|nr:ComEC/Rec2 family competence protein [Flavobacteriales bacterium]